MADFEDRLRAAVTSQADGFRPSGDLPDRIRSRVARRRRQQRLLAGGLAAGVATAVLLAGVLVVDPPSEGDRVETADPPTTSTTTRRAPTTVAEGTTTTDGSPSGTTTTTAAGGTTGTTRSPGDGTGGPGTTAGGGSPDPSGTASTTVPPSTTTRRTLRPPDSETPAAGTCGSFSATVVEITINADIPSPRCVQVRPDQSLRVANASGETVEVSFAGRSATLADGASQAYPQAFGDYLAPGVHRVTASLYGGSGAEVWLMP